MRDCSVTKENYTLLIQTRNLILINAVYMWRSLPENQPDWHARSVEQHRKDYSVSTDKPSANITVEKSQITSTQRVRY